MNPYAVVSEPNPSGDPGFCCSNYRQIRYEVFADSTVTPDLPMYCDVYINDVYYKTFTSYTIKNSGPSFFLGYYLFDIQDALQEYLNTFIDFASLSVSIVNSLSSEAIPIANVQCFFRGSTIIGGILTPMGPVPVQATSTTPAVSGNMSYASNRLLCLNSSITPDFKNIYSNNLETKLKEKQIVVAPLPHDRVYPLSNFPSINNAYIIDNIPLCLRTFAKDNGQFPFIVQEFPESFGLSNWFRNCQAMFLYWDSTLTLSGIYAITPTSTGINAGSTYYLPFGLADILSASPIPLSVKSLLTDPKNNMYYCVGLFDDDSNSYCCFSPLVFCGNKSVEDVRIWFQNVYGHFDQITFIRNEEKFTVTSGEQFTPYDQTINDEQAGSYTSLLKGKKRYNIRPEDEISLYTTVGVEHMPWIKELFSSPFIMQQTFGSTAGFTSMEIIDDSIQTKKKLTEQGIKYQITLRMKPSIPLIQLRN